MAYAAYPDMPEAPQAPRGDREHVRAHRRGAFPWASATWCCSARARNGAGGRDKSSILADALEAVFGAVYLDRGLAVATELIERLFRPRMQAYVRGEGDRDYKTILQELASQALRSMPEYRLEERGPDHEKEVHGHRAPGREPMGTGIGRSKKEAEQRAAAQAYARIAERLAPDTGGLVRGDQGGAA